LSKMGVLDRPLPQALAAPPYARIGDFVFLTLLVLGAFAGVVLNRRS